METKQFRQVGGEKKKEGRERKKERKERLRAERAVVRKTNIKSANVKASVVP